MLEGVEKPGIFFGQVCRFREGKGRREKEKRENEKRPIELLKFVQMNNNTAAVIKRLSKEAGKIIFQPNRINWS